MDWLTHCELISLLKNMAFVFCFRGEELHTYPSDDHFVNGRLCIFAYRSTARLLNNGKILTSCQEIREVNIRQGRHRFPPCHEQCCYLVLLILHTFWPLEENYQNMTSRTGVKVHTNASNSNSTLAAVNNMNSNPKTEYNIICILQLFLDH